MLAVVNGQKSCPPYFERDENGVCVFENKNYYNCPANTYAQGSGDNCREHKIVYGNDVWPADTKTTSVWWKLNRQSTTCAKTHNVRKGVYCPKSWNAKTTYQKAKNICVQAGGRVCTAKELREGATRGTGCNYNWKRIWSSTPCGPNKVITTSGAAEFLGQIGGEKCTAKAGKSANVRCCMDTYGRNQQAPPCLDCPDGLISDAGSVGEDSCKCKNVKNGLCEMPSPFSPMSCGRGEFAAGSLADGNALEKMVPIGGNVRNSNGLTVYKSTHHEIPTLSSLNAVSSYCVSRGARLCTLNEAKSAKFSKRIWTSTKCSKGKQAVVVNGKFVKCVDIGSGLALGVCCADDGAQYCDKCPANNDNTSGKTGIYSCEPKNGYHAVLDKNGPVLSFVKDETCPANTYLDTSSHSCVDLGWTNAGAGRSKKVCSNSRVNGKCSGRVTKTQAEAFCSAVGARLCSVEELENDEAAGTGCNLDGKRSWTRNACSGGAMTVGGSKRSSKKRTLRAKCEPSSTQRFARCCASTEMHCADCPSNSLSNSGSDQLTDCKCDTANGFYGVNGGVCAVPTPAPTTRAPGQPKNPNKVHEPLWDGEPCPAKEFLAGSVSGCNALGLLQTDRNRLRNEAGKKPCGTARNKFGVCLGTKTFSDAKKHCEDRYMRLCSSMEIVEEVPKNHGKDANCWGTPQNPKLYWTFKPCREDVKWKGGTSNQNNARTIFYHVVSAPYDTALGVRGNGALGQEDYAYPGTANDECLNGKGSAKRWTACCADVGGQYCAMCPRNSCTDFNCPSGATDNTDCICDDKDYEAINRDGTSNTKYLQVLDFNYDIEFFKVCLPKVIEPTNAPTIAPTGSPASDYCPANQYWNGAAGNPMLQAGEGNWACNHAQFGMYHPMAKESDWTNTALAKITNRGPTATASQTTWPKQNGNLGCRGDCMYEEGNLNSASTCKVNWLSFHNQKICTMTDKNSWYFFEDKGEDASYKTDHCTQITTRRETKETSTKKATTNCCSKTLDWPDAKAFCEAAGARLCTLEEVTESCAERTGCDYDYTWIWTSTECRVKAGVRSEDGSINYSNVPGYMSAPGDQRKWDRKFPGDCSYNVDTSDTANGHKACVLSSDNANYQQGMPHTGDAVPYANTKGYGAKTGMGKEDVSYKNRALNWLDDDNTDGQNRYYYTDAMKDLFAWESNIDVQDTNSYPNNRPNPMDDTTHGAVCLPASVGSDYRVFVRCCADHVTNVPKKIGSKANANYPEKMYCLDCPAGYTNNPGNSKDFYTCTCPGTVNSSGDCIP